MGQIGHSDGSATPLRTRPLTSRLARGVLGVSAATVIASTLAGCGTSLADASTTLRSAHGVTIVSTNGTRTAGVAGATLQRGDQVVTGRHGAASLVTRDRVVYLLPNSALTVDSGVAYALQKGTAVANAEAGDGLDVSVAGYDVAVPSGSATRLSAGVTTTVSQLSGAALVRSGSGARLPLTALHQVTLGGDALPTTSTVLHLVDDRADSATVPDLVRDDEMLNTLASGIDGSGASSTSAIDADWATSQAGSASHGDATRGTARSNKILSIVFARTVGGSRSAAAYRHAVQWRAAGGSWGVIARLLGVDASAVSGELSSLERVHGGNVATLVNAVLHRNPTHRAHARSHPSTGQRRTGGHTNTGGQNSSGTPHHGSTGPSGHKGSGGTKPTKPGKPSKPAGLVGGTAKTVTGTVKTVTGIVKTVVHKLPLSVTVGKPSPGSGGSAPASPSPKPIISISIG